MTGGIGSGKSTLAKLMQIMGVPVYFADDRSKILLNKNSLIKSQLIHRFGPDIYTKEGANKPLLASLIFGNSEHMAFVNALVHPILLEDFITWSSQFIYSPIIVMEAAILFESGFDKHVDKTLLVCAPLEQRIASVMKRDSSSREQVVRIIAAQLSEQEKREKSDFILHNDGQSSLIIQLGKIISPII